MRSKLKKDMVVSIVSGKEKGKLGVVRTTPFSANNVQVIIWEGMYYADTFIFNENELEVYENPDKLIRPLAIGDSMVILEKPRIFFNARTLKYKGQTLLIDDIHCYSGGDKPTHYTNKHPSNYADFEIEVDFSVEVVDVAATNRLLIRKYGIPLKRDSLPQI